MATQENVVQQNTSVAPLRAIVPMIHVADVERSAQFYRLLGFEIGNRVPPHGPMHWAWLYSTEAADWRLGPNLMLTRGGGPPNPDARDVVFYLYATDLVGLRNELIAKQVEVSEITFPDYLPKGEFQTIDPDGHCLMVAQAAADTP